jgi:hypothetical protein
MRLTIFHMQNLTNIYTVEQAEKFQEKFPAHLAFFGLLSTISLILLTMFHKCEAHNWIWLLWAILMSWPLIRILRLYRFLQRRLRNLRKEIRKAARSLEIQKQQTTTEGLQDRSDKH